MATRVAIIGPGRLGGAIGRRWSDAGVELVGFVGRSSRSVASALEFCGAGMELRLDDLVGVDAVLVSVGDRDLDAAVREVASTGCVAAGSLWFHASGYHGVEVLQPIRERAAHVGILHPLCPIPDFEQGVRSLDGAPATCLTEPRDERLRELASLAGLRPLDLAPDADRAAYHAACALAANGATALFDLVEGLFAQSLEPAAARRATTALMRGALDLCDDAGAAAALSGPAVRGDTGVVAGHLRVLGGEAPEAAYRALMSHAVSLARSGSLPDDAARALRELLGDDRFGDHG